MAEATMISYGIAIGMTINLAFVCLSLWSKGHLELIEDNCIKEDEITTVEPLVQPVSVTVKTDEAVIEMTVPQILCTSERAQVTFMIERVMTEM